MLGDAFRVRAPGGALDLLLCEATALPTRAAGRQPFALLFREPAGAMIPQGTYPVDHPALGTFDLFVVPLGPDAGGMRYEAVFG